MDIEKKSFLIVYCLMLNFIKILLLLKSQPAHDVRTTFLRRRFNVVMLFLTSCAGFAYYFLISTFRNEISSKHETE